ncbi:MAG: hypothetical protein HY235_26305 [Acidobacteria bacterium]|nr:hypothetical protein [Acidobacteriota bacterium]
MSITPQFPPPFPDPAGAEAFRPEYRWYHKVAAVLFAIFCFELGVFLLVFPWLDFWENNFFATWNYTLQQMWMNPYFRGMISGLGLVNIFVSFIEIVRLRRFSSS